MPHPEESKVETASVPEADTPEGRARTEARKHIEKRRGLQANLVSFVVVNAFLVGIWATTGAGYFWPGWVMAAWGLGVVFQLWDYFRQPVTEADVDAEVRRMQGRGR
ncbi:MAG TPA: 2TM domain-containing protein [Acidimicrobiales bacterium]|nr:2TM domain-containing protein [Acidimicrobiales bacterium]